jgi:hypothetical protein
LEYKNDWALLFTRRESHPQLRTVYSLVGTSEFDASIEQLSGSVSRSGTRRTGAGDACRTISVDTGTEATDFAMPQQRTTQSPFEP